MHTFYISINDGMAVPSQDLSLAVQSLEFHNMQSDIAALTWTRANPLEACPIVDRDMVEIWLDGRRLFRGRAIVGAVSNAGAPVRLMGVYQELEEVYYQSSEVSGLSAKLGETVEEASIPGSEYQDSSGVWQPMPDFVTYTYRAFGPRQSFNGVSGYRNLNYFWSGCPRIFVNEGFYYRQVIAEFNNVLGMFAYTTLPSPLPYSVGIVHLSAMFGPKTRNVQDVTVGEALRQVMTPLPTAAIWFDYAVSGPPTLNARLAQHETPVVLQVGKYPLRDYSLDALHDLVPSGVMVRWETPVTFAGPGVPEAVDSSPYDVVCYQPRILLMTVAQDMPAGLGLAALIYADFATLRSMGTLLIVDRDFSLGLRPGMVITLEGDAMLEGVQHWVQSVQWNALTGEATLTMGYPRHLSLQEWRDLRNFGQRVLMPPGWQVPQVTFL